MQWQIFFIFIQHTASDFLQEFYFSWEKYTALLWRSMWIYDPIKTFKNKMPTASSAEYTSASKHFWSWMFEKCILFPVTDKHLHAALCFSSWSFKEDTHNLTMDTQPQKSTKKCDKRWKVTSQIFLCTDLKQIFFYFYIIFLLHIL